MPKSILISKIDDILKKYQFYRKKSTWNREFSDFVDVIDLQISKFGDSFTINVGVAHKFVNYTCWGGGGSSLVEEPTCTVRKRLGELLHGRDVWWSLSDGNDFEEILSGIQDVAIPFLQLNHNVDCMIKTLESDPASSRYPPGVIYLALLYRHKGEDDRCSEMFESMKLIGGWGQRAADIRAALDELHCGSKRTGPRRH